MALSILTLGVVPGSLAAGDEVINLGFELGFFPTIGKRVKFGFVLIVEDLSVI